MADAVRQGVGAAGAAWLDRALTEAATGSRTQLLTAYTAASRQLGQRPLEPTGPVPALPDGLSLERWTLEDAGRLALLLARHDAAADPALAAADLLACYENGDAREQSSWLRGVALLPSPERFLATVIDACRTNNLPQFEAVACENPYPARYFPDRNFNQLVLKSLFNGVALLRIVGLAERLNPDLARMAVDYAAERRAAGRAVPGDISLAMAGAAPGAHS